jgi:hypothetical protein
MFEAALLPKLGSWGVGELGSGGEGEGNLSKMPLIPLAYRFYHGLGTYVDRLLCIPFLCILLVKIYCTERSEI